MKIQTDVDEVLWRRARVAALQMGKTVGDFVELALVDFMDAVEGNLPIPTKSQMQTIKEEEREKQRGALGQVATEKGGSTPPLPTISKRVVVSGLPLEVGDEEPVATMKCWKCKDKVLKWTLDVKGHAWCDSCLEDARNAIP